MTKQQKITALQKRLNNQFFNALILDYYSKDKIVELRIIEVKEEFRKQGYGTKAMQEICQLCDEIGCVLVLFPSKEFGTSKRVLLKFYRGFGLRFERRKDYEDKYKNFMKRQPQKDWANNIIPPLKIDKTTKEEHEISMGLHCFPKLIQYENLNRKADDSNHSEQNRPRGILLNDDRD